MSLFFNIAAASLNNIATVVSSVLTVTPVKKIVEIDTLSIGQMTYSHIYKSSEHPQFTTTKPYFTLYSTDHESDANGQIWWGEMDDLEWTNFAEVARIPTGGDGAQPETPYLVTKDGVGYVFYHTSQVDERNPAGVQQTQCMTSSGGAALHLCTWTERTNAQGGSVLGLLSGENHTGYLIPFKLSDGTYIGFHSKYVDADFTNNISAVSTSTDLLNWTRGADIVHNRLIPDGSNRNHSRLEIYPFYNNGKLMALVPSNFTVAVVELGNDFLPNKFVTQIFDRRNSNGDVIYSQQTRHLENGQVYVGIRSTTGTYTPVPGDPADGDWYQITFNASGL